MASTKMELSLDDIIKTNPKVRRGGARGGRGGVGGRGGRGGRGAGGGGGLTRRGGLGGGRGGLGGGLRRSGGGGGRASFGRSPRGAADGIWVHDKFQDGGFGRRTGGIRTASGAGGAGGGGGSKITVSNLHYGVSDADIIELFGEIGAIRYASVHYDRSGRSMGKADVVFDRRGDAQNAINQYNGVPLDGRAMAITFANAPTAVAISPRSPIRQVQGGRIGRRPGTGPVRGRGGRGRGTGGRGAGGGRGGKKPAATPTAAELDAELDAYISANPK